MNEPEETLAYPLPAEAGAHPDRDESAHDEQRKQRMRDKHRIG
jgi:hypothetical protein